MAKKTPVEHDDTISIIIPTTPPLVLKDLNFIPLDLYKRAIGLGLKQMIEAKEITIREVRTVMAWECIDHKGKP